MARPQKQTVDYFPHFVNKGKTKLILQNEFHNDGYAFWYQLLELLCVSDNQVYDYNNPASLRLLLAETHVTEDIAIKILQLLADLSAIDPELHKNRIIWSQNLVDNLDLVYRRRATGTPTKPVIADINPVIADINRQTKLNNTKLNKTIIPKNTYGEFSNVLLTDDEHQKLKERFNNNLPAMIEELSTGIASKGYKYKNHYATLLSWAAKKEREGKSNVVGKYRGNPSQKPAGAFSDIATEPES